MSANRAPFPETALADFGHYRTWATAGEIEEIGLEDPEETIQRARESDRDHVATLMYLGIDTQPMWIMRGFYEPDGDKVERWFICSAPWPFDQKEMALDTMISADYLGHCTLCNPEDDESSDDNCPECSGDGSTQYWFEDFDENGIYRG